jgi:hypothetical protein
MMPESQNNEFLANCCPNTYSRGKRENRPINELLEVVVSRRFASSYKREFIGEFIQHS